MTRHATARKAASTAALLAAAGLALAGCKSSTSASGTASSPAAGGSSSASSSSSAGSGTSGSGGSGQTASSGGTTYFPVAAGNTWVYETTLSGTGHGTITNKMTSVTPVADGQRVTMAISQTAVGTGTPTYVTYIFHSDGSISVPFTQVGSTTVKIKSGSIVWPSAAQLSSGQPQKSTIVFEASVAGHVTNAKADVTVQGHGSQNVTVPAGTYHAQLIDETISEKFDGVAIGLTVETWVANGVGPVKSDLLSKASTAGIPTTVEVLKSFTKG